LSAIPADITHALARSEERFRLLVETVQDYAIFLLDPKGFVVTWNKGAERIKGYKASEIIGKHFSQFYPAEVVASGWPQRELELATEQGRFEDEGWRLRKDGSRFWANVIITALHDPAGQLYGFAKITRDLSERRQHEEALRQSEERFRLLIENVPDTAIFMLDPEGRVQSWNAGAQLIKGYTAPEIIGKHFSIFYTADDQQAGKPALELALALERGRAYDEGWRVRKDGSVFWASITITAVYNSEGELHGFAKVTRDMSERRRLAELESSTRRMNEFLAMLAHELRNPLAPIRNAVSIMQLEEIDSPRLRTCRDIIDRQLAHLTRLVDDLLDVGRITTGKISLKRERLQYQDIIARSVEAARPLMEARGHTLLVEVPPTPLYVTGDATRLAQVLQNLLSNAAKYTDAGGQVRLEVRQEGPSAVTTVEDNGRGIEPEALARIFDLFEQEEANNNPTEGGLGIGLTLARTLVELHGGTIRAFSAGRGRGSRFVVRLPLEGASATPGQPDGATASAPSRRCRVLVVDDNRDSADTMVQLLEALGQQAQAAYSGEEALRIALAGRLDLVLLDLNMPGISGFEVCQQLQALGTQRPKIIAAMTGYGREGDRVRTFQTGFDAHLMKPIGMEALKQVVEQTLAAP
jgi:PAS domain S-box-containing protein